ncbi:MAG: hypothetical protein PHF86_11350 [Candidatus Nanoarchaeia archaeon]|nr:hypothetical protein [Candidatus Nanoarchaeia archaeon]
MNKKAVSPLIAYILLIGMVIAISAIVGNFLIKQARDINFESKEIEIYCADVAIDAYPVCSQTLSETNKIIGINITNRGYYSVGNLSIVKREGTSVKTLVPEEFSFFTYTDGTINTIQTPLDPENKGMLKVVVDTSKLPSTEFLITPILKINDKIASCNEKVFKLSNIQLLEVPCT